MISRDMLRLLAPRARPDSVQALAGDVGAQVLAGAGITVTDARLAMALATMLHEAGEDLGIRRESGTYTSAERIRDVWPSRFAVGWHPKKADARQFVGKPVELFCKVYNGRMGNRPGTDDGWRYRGGGLIQLTGRDAYRRCGQAIGVDLEGNPDLIEDPVASLKAFCWEWTEKRCNALADAGNFRGVSNAINRGNAKSSLDPIGWKDRQRCFGLVRAAMAAERVGRPVRQPKPVPAAPGEAVSPVEAVPGALGIGDHGEAVAAAQRRLRDKGYAMAGAADGVFGPAMRRAVLALQSDRGLPTTGEIDDATAAALADDQRIDLGLRATATADDLAAAGSTQITVARATQQVMKGLAGAGAVAVVAEESGVLDQVIAVTGKLGELRAPLGALLETLGALGANPLALGIVGLAALAWAGAAWWEQKRVAGHRAGENMGV